MKGLDADVWRRGVGCLGLGMIVLAEMAVRAGGSSKWIERLSVSGPICPLKQMAGLQCSFCGMTRAFLCLLGGEYERAMGFNVLSLPIFFGMIGWLLLVSLGYRKRLSEGSRRMMWVGSGVGMVIYAVARNFFTR